MNLLLVNFLLYFFWFAYSYIKEKRISIYSTMILFYTIIAFLGIYIYKTGLYTKEFGNFSLSRITIFPIILGFVSYFFLLYPLKKIKFDKNGFNKLKFNKRSSRFILLWIIYFSLYFILKLGELIISISTGLDSAYEHRHDGASTPLFNYNNPVLEKFSFLGDLFLNTTTPFVVGYAIIGIYQKKIKINYGLFLILLCFFPSLANSIAIGSRGAMFLIVFNFIFFISIFKPFITKQLSKRIKIFGISFLSLVATYSWVITSLRFSNAKGNKGFDSILRYFGESFPNFFLQIWDQVKYHPFGERLFPVIAPIKKTYSHLTLDETTLFWQNKVDVPIYLFKTYYGDLYIEYGVIYGLLFAFLYFLLIFLYLKKVKLSLKNLLIPYLYFQVCVYGFSGLVVSGTSLYWSISVVFTTYLILKYIMKD
ncbi:oligosaccharide repeat unit polymerase [Rhizosphaericola mali]|uniref:Oligosaccharide repeat unit polymerase n=2 Tax=Rhizosphaericola mali TaxID=2545455 RepID=A0A5P2G605_9BACT|nr:oligosaccharide repeat unit polymerase [Rhizosphaericola mali]